MWELFIFLSVIAAQLQLAEETHPPFLIARSIQSICCCCCCSSWINSKNLLENSRNWKLSKLKVVRIESCQKCKLPKLQVAKIASCQNCKLPKLKIAKIASCQSWNWFFYFLLKVSIFDELSWKLPNCKLPKLQVVKIASCQNWKLPKLQVA